MRYTYVMQPHQINSQETNPPPHIAHSQPPKKNNGLRAFLSILEFCATVAALVFIILMFGLQSYHVEGQSMVPTLQQDDRLIVSKLGRTWSRVRQNEYIPERGDIIVFESPIENNIRIIKRVIGLPGERVVLENGTYTVYNKENPQGFQPDNLYDKDHQFEYTVGTVDQTVPDGEIFVSGDNRGDGGSQDSRNDLGTIPVENIIGKLILRIAPISEARSF
jgi:signal peptidase I